MVLFIHFKPTAPTLTPLFFFGYIYTKKRGGGGGGGRFKVYKKHIYIYITAHVIFCT